MITMFGKIQRLTNLVVNVEMATQEWVDDWTASNPDSEYAYHYGHSEDPLRVATVGGTYDEPTTWFIPVSPGPDFTFDRDDWKWVQGDTPQP